MCTDLVTPQAEQWIRCTGKPHRGLGVLASRTGDLESARKPHKEGAVCFEGEVLLCRAGAMRCKGEVHCA